MSDVQENIAPVETPEVSVPTNPTVPAPPKIGPCLAYCGKIVPGEGFCSHRCKDRFARVVHGKQNSPGKQGVLPQKKIPQNIRVEIAKRGTPWNKAWNEYVARVENAKNKKEEPSEERHTVVEPEPATPESLAETVQSKRKSKPRN